MFLVYEVFFFLLYTSLQVSGKLDVQKILRSVTMLLFFPLRSVIFFFFLNIVGMSQQFFSSVGCRFASVTKNCTCHTLHVVNHRLTAQLCQMTLLGIGRILQCYLLFVAPVRFEPDVLLGSGSFCSHFYFFIFCCNHFFCVLCRLEAAFCS